MLTWYIADLKSGEFVEELPIKLTGSLESTIGQKLTLGVSLDIHDPSCPPGWPQLLDGRRTLIVPVDDDTPLNAYALIDAPEIGGPTVTLTLATMEYIAERVFVPTGDFYEDTDDEGDVAAWLLAKVATGWGFDLDVTQTGRTGDHAYSEYEDRTVASAISDLSAQDGGPEVAYRIRWADGTHRRFIKTIEIGPQVGQTLPATIFENHHLALRRRARSWQSMAVDTVATGDGVGESRPVSTHVIDDEAIAAGVPPWEARVAAPSIDDEFGLDRVAVKSAARNRYGTQKWSLTVAQTTPGAPVLCVDYDTGDIVTADLQPTRDDPAELAGPVRVIGWRAEVAGRSITEVTPVLYDPNDEELI